jgi:hypothetical protein
MVSGASVHHGGKTWQSNVLHLSAVREPSSKMPELAAFLVHPDLWLSDGASHIEDSTDTDTPRVCLTNLLATSQYNFFGNQV